MVQDWTCHSGHMWKLIRVSASRLSEIPNIEAASHYNVGRPHSSLGPGLPGPLNTVVATARASNFLHWLEEGAAVQSKSVLGGLRHEYSLVPAVA